MKRKIVSAHHSENLNITIPFPATNYFDLRNHGSDKHGVKYQNPRVVTEMAIHSNKWQQEKKNYRKLFDLISMNFLRHFRLP